MAEEDDTSTAPAAPALDYSQLPALLDKLGLTPPTPVQHGGPGQGGVVGFLGDVGKTLAGGGSGLLDLSPEESDRAGLHALMNASINMLMASGPSYVPRGIGQIIGYGLQGAQEGYQGSELATAQRLAAQQAGQQQQYTDRMQAVKAALPLLQMQMRANLPNPFASTGSGTGSGSTTAGGFTGDKAKDLALIKQRESGGDYNILNYVAQQDPTAYDRGATASGGYQIVNSTWREGMQLAGLDPSKYPTARDAPAAVQDQVAGALYDKYGTKPWQKGSKDWVKDENGRYQLATVTPPPGSPGGAPPAPTAAAAPPAAPGGAPAAPVPRVQVATAVPTGPSATATDATPAPPAAPAPGQPRDITALKDEELSLPEYQQRYRTPLPPDAGVVKVDPQVQADQQQAVAAAQQAMSQAQAGMRAAEQDWTVQRDDKSLQARSAAQQRLETAQTNLQTAQQNASKLVQDAATASVTNRQTLQTEQDKQLAAAYDAARQRAATVALKTQEGEQAIRLAGITSDVQAGQKVLEAVNATRDGAQDTVNALDLAKNLSKQAGTSGFLQQWPNVANALVRNNLLTKDEVDQLGAQRGLDQVLNKVVLSMRAGSGISRMTNFDLQFLQNTAPSSFTPEQMRPAMFAAIQTAAARQVQYVDRVNELHASGMPVWQARQKADEDLGHLVKETPTVYPQGDRRAGQPMSVDDQNAWITRNVPDGMFYTKPDGSLAIRGLKKTQQGQQ